MRIKPSILYGVPEPEGQEGGSFYGWRGGDQDNGWREGDHDNGSFYGWRGGDQDNNHKRDNMKRELAPAIMPDIWEWKHVTPTGPQPVERSLYGGFISQENLFVIFGGATWGSDGYRTNQLNDMWAIDTKTWFFPPFKQVGTGDLLYPGWIFGEYGQWLYGEYGPNENYEAPQWKQITPPATTVRIYLFIIAFRTGQRKEPTFPSEAVVTLLLLLSLADKTMLEKQLPTFGRPLWILFRMMLSPMNN